MLVSTGNVGLISLQSVIIEKFRNTSEVFMGFLDSVVSFFKTEEEAPVPKVGRNDVCWCGSGKKYKKCHLLEDEKKMAKKYASNCGNS